MFTHEAPTITLSTRGAQLRTAAVKLLNHCVVFDGVTGGTANRDALKAFWEDQKMRITLSVDPGLPSDGLFMGLGLADIRIKCYHVLSDLRLFGGLEGADQWEAFCQYFIDQATVAPIVPTENTLVVNPAAQAKNGVTE